MYSKAIELYPSSAIYYANRALAHLRQENFGLALQDGVSAVKTDPSYLKGYYRRAAAHMSLGKFKQALSDFEYVSECLTSCVDIHFYYEITISRWPSAGRMIRMQSWNSPSAVK